ncbi:hypothetical protein MOQ_002056 [Trypanosoma cruzi marinkellei]|uniref:Uncharacterized protein n=1 Tax=Trypanosoma cruzi marinkellei TaxID=85056 RepID=K2MR25_TRYCR|nr:hypothetical protein MOQ_002056 [Trypanosoma cruzi marinkellei]
MDVVAPHGSPRSSVRFNLEGERAREQTKSHGEMEKKTRALERQVRVLLKERENHLDALEEMHRAVQRSNAEAELLREELQMKAAEVEEIRQKAKKEALWVVKSEWRNKLDGLARSNTQLLHEVRLRDKSLEELQQKLCELSKAEDTGAPLLDRVTLLTAELLRREKIMSEKDAVLYAYEARLERAERGSLSALESQCRAEIRASELSKERDVYQRALKELFARNEELGESAEQNIFSSQCMSEGSVHTPELAGELCEKGTGTELCQLEKYESLVSLLQIRLANSEVWMNMRSLLVNWMAFVLQKKITAPQMGKMRHFSNQAFTSLSSEAPEGEDKDVSLMDKEEEEETEIRREVEIVEESNEVLKATETASEEQKHETEREENAREDEGREMSKVVKALEQHLALEPLEKIYAMSKQSSRSNLHVGTSDLDSLSLARKSSNPLIPQITADPCLAQDKSISNSVSITDKKEKKEEDAEEALSSAVESLHSLQDGSEASAIIATLLSLHRQGVGVWRRRALLAEQQMEEWRATVSTLSGLLQQQMLPYLFVLYEMYTTAMTDKINIFLEDNFRLMKCASANRYETYERSVIGSSLFIMLRYWSKWRVHLEVSRLVMLREKATRTVSSMAEQHEQLKAIAQRAMMRIRDFEGPSGRNEGDVAGI